MDLSFVHIFHKVYISKLILFLLKSFPCHLPCWWGSRWNFINTSHILLSLPVRICSSMAHWSHPQWILPAVLWIQFSTVFPCPTYIPTSWTHDTSLGWTLSRSITNYTSNNKVFHFSFLYFLVSLKFYHEIDLLIFSLFIKFSITLKSLMMVTGCWSWQGEPKSESFHLSQIFSNHCHGRSISYPLNHYCHTYILFMQKCYLPKVIEMDFILYSFPVCLICILAVWHNIDITDTT